MPESTPSDVREQIRLKRLEVAKAKARQEKRENLLGHVMIILFCALLGSGILWLIAQIWLHMPF